MSAKEAKSVQQEWIDEYVKLRDEHAILKQRFFKAERILEREGYRQCDIPTCNCGSWHWSPPQRADQHTQPPVSVYLPQGYTTAEDFAKDCGLELVGQPVLRAGSPDTGDVSERSVLATSLDREIELLRKIEKLLVEKERLRWALRRVEVLSAQQPGETQAPYDAGFTAAMTMAGEIAAEGLASIEARR